MIELDRTARRRPHRTQVTALALLAATAFSAPAFARHHHHHSHRGRLVLARHFERIRPAHVRPGSFTPLFAAYAVDGNSGRVLYAQDENALRHPASITKVMTLYLLFERLERGQLSLDDRIAVSEHAAAQSPTKLGLRPGSTIRIEDAIKSIVTKSANDMAVAIAERLGGDERTFAQMMTRKAHSLGMSRSNFVNASGLPDDMQLTTAHDLVILGRAIHDRYPRYYHLFSTPSFRYAGQYMANHNHLMEQVDGMDGIKTGYTRSSGFNLLSSVNRNGHWLVSVVLGGKTRLGRDRIMADLIESQIDKCATSRTTPMIAENPALEHVAEANPVIQHEGDAAPPVEGVDEDAAESKTPRRNAPEATTADEDEGSPAVTEAKSEGMADGKDPSENGPAPPSRLRSASPAPEKPAPTRDACANAHEAAPQPRPRPAFVSGLPRSGEHDMTTTGSIRGRGGRDDGTTGRYAAAGTATPSTLKRNLKRDRASLAKPIKVASLAADVETSATRPAVAPGGWMIQIGATPTIAKANDLIARAKEASHGALTGAHPFTEKVQKGSETLFRARFAGLDAGGAESACRNLKRAGLSCFATKN